MLSAYLYRVRKSLLKRPLKFVLLLLAVAMSVFMIFFPTLMADSEDAVVRNPNLVLGGISLVLMLMFDFMFYSGVKNGVVGFSNSDVNFHLAGPFTEKFNLIILVEGVITTCAMLLWVLSCQVAVLYSIFGVNSVDVLALLVGGLFSMLLSYLVASFLGAKFAEEEGVKNKILIGLLAVNLVLIGGFLLSMVKRYGSFGAVTSLGIKNIIADFGSSIFSQCFPVAGWLSLIYGGIVKNSLVYLLVGIALIVLFIVFICALYANVDLDYYETAIANAQKVADIIEARKAGVDTDTANMNKKIKVGKESLKSGWGASAFTYMHFLQNARASKFFFVNSLALLYRFITAVYMFMMKGTYEDDKMMALIMGLMMISLLNVVIYGGGKTVLEFNKPFIFMVPESGPKKLFACLMADLPEMTFDSILATAIFWFILKPGPLALGGLFVFIMVFDCLCELTALVMMRLFRGLGRFLLMFVRYILIYAFFFIAMIPAIVVYYIVGSLAALIGAGALGGIIMIAIMLLCSANIVDRVEFEK